MTTDTLESHKPYLDTLWQGATLLVISSLVLMVATGVAYAAGNTPHGWEVNGVSLAFAIGAALALILVAVVIIGIAIAFYTISRNQQHQRAMDLLDRQPTQIKVIEQPAAAPAAPLVLSSGVEISPHMVGDWLDQDDLKSLCAYIAKSKTWTAAKLEGFPLTNSHDYITNKDSTNAQGQPKPTTYARVMRLFTECMPPIIDQRGGPGNKTGTLTTTDPDEMFRRIMAHHGEH